MQYFLQEWSIFITIKDALRIYKNVSRASFPMAAQFGWCPDYLLVVSCSIGLWV